MRIRLNEHHSIPFVPGRSDLYTRFRKVFDKIVRSTSPGVEHQQPNDWYVSLPMLEARLNEVLYESTDDTIRFLVGHTGIGKTTVLQHVIGLDQHIYRTEQKTYVVYMSCNPREIRDAAAWTSNFCGELRAAAEKIRKDWEIPAVTDDDLANFILVNSPRVLYGVEAPINTNNSELVRLLFQRNRRHYELEYLKLLTCTPGGIEHLGRICIVVDDIEALSHQVQLFAVKQLLQSHLCLQHNQGRKYLVSTVIAVRPNTYASLCAEPDLRDATNEPDEVNLSPFTFEPIDFGEPVDLQELFKARFKTEARGEHFESGDAERAIEVCNAIAASLKGGFGNDLIALANGNVRDALGLFMRILQNRTWFQRNMNPQAAFQVVESDYAVNAAGVLRALAMPKSLMYVDHNNIPIANVLHNTAEESSDLLVSYVLRHFLRSADKVPWESIWEAHDLAEVVRMLGRWLNVEGKEIDFTPTLDWMSERKLLWRLDADDHKLRFSITPRAVQTWALLASNAILLQCFREDTYRSVESPTWSVPTHKSALRPDELFLDCVQLAQEVADIEYKHLGLAKLRKMIPLLRDTFGLNMLSQQMFIGLCNTQKQYFSDQSRIESDLVSPMKALQSAIERNIQTLAGGVDQPPAVGEARGKR